MRGLGVGCFLFEGSWLWPSGQGGSPTATMISGRDSPPLVPVPGPVVAKRGIYTLIDRPLAKFDSWPLVPSQVRLTIVQRVRQWHAAGGWSYLIGASSQNTRK